MSLGEAGKVVSRCVYVYIYSLRLSQRAHEEGSQLSVTWHMAPVDQPLQTNLVFRVSLGADFSTHTAP